MKSSFQIWKKSLPDSEIIMPDNLPDKAKYIFWRLFTPLHPFFRDNLLWLGLIKHEGRQNFLIGHIAPNYTLEDVVEFLVGKGYGNHFIAWVDDGELVGLRYVPNFSTQYHIRFFHDGEIRGHYEYTPECYPILHMRDVGMKNCNEEFLKLLGDFVVAK